MSLEAENRSSRLRKLAEVLLKATKRKDALHSRVNGLEDFERDFLSFCRESDIPNEDDALQAFSDLYLKSKRQAPRLGSKKKPEKATLDRFMQFSLHFLDNLTQPPSGSGLPEPLTMDDLWDGLMAFGRVKVKDYVKLGRENMSDERWKKARRKEGYAKPLGPVNGPLDILGVKKWTPSLEKSLSEYRSTFESLVTGFLRGYSLASIDWDKKTSDILNTKDLRQLSDARNQDAFAHDGVIDASDPSNPRLHGIAMPACVMWQLSNEAKDETEREKWLKRVKTLPPLNKT